MGRQFVSLAQATGHREGERGRKKRGEGTSFGNAVKVLSTKLLVRERKRDKKHRRGQERFFSVLVKGWHNLMGQVNSGCQANPNRRPLSGEGEKFVQIGEGSLKQRVDYPGALFYCVRRTTNTQRPPHGARGGEKENSFKYFGKGRRRTTRENQVGFAFHADIT